MREPGVRRPEEGVGHQIAMRGHEGPACHGGNMAAAVDAWHRGEERRVDDAPLLATRRGTQPRAQLIERRARRHERVERVGGKMRVEHAVVECHRADRMRLPRLGVVPGILERPAAIGRIATAAEPEVRAGIDDAAVLVQAAAHHGGIRKQLEEPHGFERPGVVHDPRVVPQNVQQAAALGRSRGKARQARHAFRRDPDGRPRAESPSATLKVEVDVVCRTMPGPRS